MKIAGIIAEYNPLHGGHTHLMEEICSQLGEDTAIVCVMSGDFVQRGDFALVRRRARAKAAVQSGADLVLELPLPWAVSSAERFADGGVRMLAATGIVTHLAFGSECGDAAALMRLAETLNSPELTGQLKEELASGVSFAAARQKAVARLLTAEQAALLEDPNNILGVEYCKSIHRHGFAMEPLTIPRKGDAHDSAEVGDVTAPSASAIRALLREGRKEDALTLMTPDMEAAYLTEERLGRAPVFLETCERAILAKLRSMTIEDFAALDEGREGLCNRLYEASRRATSVAEILEQAKTKRYAYSRLRRMLLWAYLGLKPADFPEEPAYIRPLAANAVGRQLLGMMRKRASVPVLTKPGDVRRMDEVAQKLFELEARGADLYALAYPDLSAAEGDSIWREGPVIL